MPMFDVAGACDMHIHTGPDFVERVGDDFEVAAACEKAGMKAILLKSHMESTVSRAYHAQKTVQTLKVYGALVLNSSVGGFNPFAAEAAMQYGAKEIFMPTFCAQADFKVHGKGAAALYKYGLRTEAATLCALDENGSLKPEVKQILELARDYKVPIGSSHLGADEIFALAAFAHDIGAPLIITHPEYKIPNLQPDQIRALASLGAYIEITAGAVFPIPGCSTITHDIDLIEAAGYQNCFITSDAGTPTKPMPADVLSSYAYCLQKKGMATEKIRYMLCEKPLEVFGIE